MAGEQAAGARASCVWICGRERFARSHDITRAIFVLWQGAVEPGAGGFRVVLCKGDMVGASRRSQNGSPWCWRGCARRMRGRQIGRREMLQRATRARLRLAALARLGCWLLVLRGRQRARAGEGETRARWYVPLAESSSSVNGDVGAMFGVHGEYRAAVWDCARPDGRVGRAARPYRHHRPLSRRAREAGDTSS